MSKFRWRKWQENWMKPEIKVKTDTFYTHSLLMWSLLPCYCWHSWACLDYKPRFNMDFQCGSIKVNHLSHLGHGRNEAFEMANSLSDWFISLASSRDGLGEDHPASTWLGVSIAALEGLCSKIQWARATNVSREHLQSTRSQILSAGRRRPWIQQHMDRTQLSNKAK